MSPRRGFEFLDAVLATPKLSAVMSLVFVSLSIPILIFILVYSYYKTSAAIIATLHEQVSNTRLATIDSAQNLINRWRARCGCSPESSPPTPLSSERSRAGSCCIAR